MKVVVSIIICVLVLGSCGESDLERSQRLFNLRIHVSDSIRVIRDSVLHKAIVNTNSVVELISSSYKSIAIGNPESAHVALEKCKRLHDINDSLYIIFDQKANMIDSIMKDSIHYK